MDVDGLMDSNDDDLLYYCNIVAEERDTAYEESESKRMDQVLPSLEESSLFLKLTKRR